MTFFMARSWRSSTAVSRSGLLIRLIRTAYAISTILFMDSSRRREPDTTASSPICRHWDSLRRSLTPPSSSFVVALRWCINYYMLMILPHNLLRCSLENHLNASAVVRHGPWPTSPLPGRHHGAAARGLVLAPTHLSQGHHRLHWHGRLQVVHLIKVVGGLWTAPCKMPLISGVWLMLCSTRHNMSYAVQQVWLRMHDPREPHLAALKRILLYLQGTLELGLLC
jgi:hypothetical protein